MLNSSFVAKSVDFIHVDETVSEGREVFGDAAKMSIPGELRRCKRIWGDLDRVLLSGDVDVVHANIPAATLSMAREIGCALIARRRHVPFVIHFRCTVPVMVSDHIARFALKLLLMLSNAAITLNAPSEEFVRSISRTKVFLIPNFVSNSEISISRRTESYAGPLRTVLYTGGVIESKGAFDILKIAECLPNVTFRLAGKGELPEDCNCPANVVLLGQLDRDAVIEEYMHADAFLFLSRFRGEGFSNSLAEAMSMGLPCVVSDWAANREMVSPDGGMVVDYRNLDEVVAALKSLDNPSARQAMGSSNAEKVSRLYSEEKVTAQYIEVYEAVSR